MNKYPIYTAPHQERHSGWVDPDGRKWDRPERISATSNILKPRLTSAEWFEQSDVNEKELVEALSLVHKKEMIEAIAATRGHTNTCAVTTTFDKNPDLSSGLYAGTYDLALASASLTVRALGSLYNRETNLAIALTRPPGHHAGEKHYHGLCYFNNVALAARLLTEMGSRVAILDIDVHHGDGTQDIFYDDGATFFTSLHADPGKVFPNTGKASERGIKKGSGSTLNLPFDIGVGVAEYKDKLGVALDAARDFDPDFIIVSAGFDTHRLEFPGLPSITQLDTADYEDIGNAIGLLGVPTLIALEGGYNLKTMPYSLERLICGVESCLSER